MFKGKPSARRRRRGLVIAAIALGSVIATELLGRVELFQQLHLKASDLHFLVRVRKPLQYRRAGVDQRRSTPELQAFWHCTPKRSTRRPGGQRQGHDMDVPSASTSKYEPDHDRLLAAAVSERGRCQWWSPTWSP
jgi:hypothetical protein